MLKALDTIQVAVAGDGDKSKLLKKAMRKLPVLSGLKDEADASRMGLIKYNSGIDAKINGAALSSKGANSLEKLSCTCPEEERKDGLCKVLKVDTTVFDGFRVFIESLDGGESFQADVQEVFFFPKRPKTNSRGRMEQGSGSASS